MLDLLNINQYNKDILEYKSISEVINLNNLQVLRRKNNLTQAEVAMALGVSASSVAKWETTNTFPRAELLPALADLLHCTIDDLFGRRKEETKL